MSGPLTSVVRRRFVVEVEVSRYACEALREGSRRLVIAPGKHVLFCRGRVLWLSRKREKAKSNEGMAAVYHEQFFLRSIGFNRKVLLNIIQTAILEKHECENSNRERESRKLRAYMLGHSGYWEQVPKAQLEMVRDDFEKTNSPWRRGYLFYVPLRRSQLTLCISSFDQLDLPAVN